MKKKIVSLILLTFCIFLSGCKEKEPHSIILFNKNPITKETFLNNSTQFETGKRIYYVYMTDKEIKTDRIRIKVMKHNAKARNSLTSLVYCKDFKMKKDNIYYYTDYIVIHTAGEYNMQVFQMNRLDRPDTTADFSVK